MERTVETVGVGQSEVEIAPLVDTLVCVVNPGTGDLLQFMKAGVMEVPDLFVVNKADQGPAATRTAHELASSLGLAERTDAAWSPPVLLASPRDGSGIGEILAALDAHREHLLAAGGLRERRARGREGFVLEALERRYGSYGLARLGGCEGVRVRVRERGAASSFRLASGSATRSRTRCTSRRADVSKLQELFEEIRGEATASTWSRGVELVRAGGHPS